MDWNFDMSEAPLGRDILILVDVPVWGNKEKFNRRIFIAHWDDDRYARIPKPHWSWSTVVYGKTDMRTSEVVAWMELPPIPERA